MLQFLSCVPVFASSLCPWLSLFLICTQVYVTCLEAALEILFNYTCFLFSLFLIYGYRLHSYAEFLLFFNIELFKYLKKIVGVEARGC